MGIEFTFNSSKRMCLNPNQKNTSNSLSTQTSLLERDTLTTGRLQTLCTFLIRIVSLKTISFRTVLHHSMGARYDLLPKRFNLMDNKYIAINQMES
jgi:hypothetical protein